MKTVLLLVILSISFVSVVNAQSSREKIATNIVTNFVKGEYEKVRSDFSGTLRNQFTKDLIQQLWENVIANAGNYEGVISTNELVFQGYNIVKKRLKFANDNANIEVTFNEDDKVIGLYIKP